MQFIQLFNETEVNKIAANYLRKICWFNCLKLFQRQNIERLDGLVIEVRRLTKKKQSLSFLK